MVKGAFPRRHRQIHVSDTHTLCAAARRRRAAALSLFLAQKAQGRSLLLSRAAACTGVVAKNPAAGVFALSLARALAPVSRASLSRSMLFVAATPGAQNRKRD